MTGVSNIERLEAPCRSEAEQRNVATVRAIYEGMARADFSVLPAHMAPNASIWVLGWTANKLGAHAHNPNLLPELFPNGIQFDIRQAVVEGNRVAVEWTDEAITKDGLEYRNTGVNLFLFDEEGRVIDYREYIDPEKFFAVLR